jgi:hypothetical protein
MQGTGWILYALYGAPPTGSNVGYNDVTALVSAHYAGGQTVFTATNANYGPDPDPGTFKSMLIVYAYTTATSLKPGIYPINSFQTFTATCAENGSITLPASNASSTAGVPGTVSTVNTVSDSVEQFISTEPNLPGLVSARSIAANAFAGRSEQESRMLAGRLYSDASELMGKGGTADQGAATRFSVDNIRRSLGSPLPADRYSKQYFDSLLRDTQAKTRSDPAFARRIDEASTAAMARMGCKCTINGEDAACWKCLVIIVIIIVIIIVAA